MERVFSENDIEQTAAWLWEQMKPHKVIALHGQMGAGKTTLVHALCDYLGVQDAVSSPTFSIINEYVFENGENAETIYHIDLYRLKHEEEAIRAGVEDCLAAHAYCFVEWPERASGIFPTNTLHVYLSVVDGDKRKIKIEGK